MRILYIHQYFSTRSGKGGTRSFEFARRFVARGHVVDIITTGAYMPQPYDAVTQVTYVQLEGINVTILPVGYSNRMSPRQRIWAFLKFCIQASYATIKCPRPDVVFATSTPLTIAIPAIFAKWWHRRRFVFEVRDLWPAVPIAMGYLRNPAIRSGARFLERVAYHQAAHVVALSPGMAKGVLKVKPDAKVTVIPNSCDLDLFETQPPAGWIESYAALGKPKVILYAGTIGQVNDLSYLVRVAAALKENAPDCAIAVFGEGSERSLVEALAQELGVLNENFFLYAPLPKTQISWVFNAADICVSTVIDNKALWDNSANKFFDALAASRPIAINHEGWQADLIRETGCGLVLPAGDPGRAAVMLNSFLDDDDKARNASLIARRIGESRFSRDGLANQLLEILESARVGN